MIIPYLGPVTAALTTSSIYLTVAMAAERYISLVHPFFLIKHPCLNHACAFSLPGIVFSCLFCMANWFFYFQECKSDGHLIYRGDMQVNYGLTALFNRVIPISVLIILGILIRRELNNSIVDRTGGAELGQAERKITRVGFIIAALFIFCQLLAGVLDLLEVIGLPFPDWLWSVDCMFITINSSANFLVYFINSGDVRKKVFNLLGLEKHDEADLPQRRGEVERA